MMIFRSWLIRGFGARWQPAADLTGIPQTPYQLDPIIYKRKTQRHSPAKLLKLKHGFINKDTDTHTNDLHAHMFMSYLQHTLIPHPIDFKT